MLIKNQIKYNSGGHYAWLKFNRLSEEEQNRKEMKLYNFLKEQS